MNTKYLAFDIETEKVLPPNDYDWRLHRPLGISCAATFLSDSDKPLLWYGGASRRIPTKQMNQRELQELVRYLTKQVKRGYKIVTWNGIGFDFEILAEESRMLKQCRSLAVNHIDMMFHALCRLGYGISLDSAAKGMDLVGKKENMTGVLASQLWAQGKRKKVLEYVANDVKTTLELAEICETRGLLCWITRNGKRRKLLLSNGWLSVCRAQNFPRTGTTLMWPHWSRERFTTWLG